MGQTWVTGVDWENGTDNDLVVTVALYGFEPGTRVQISGQITQSSGAFAHFSEIKTVEKLDRKKLSPKAGRIAEADMALLGGDDQILILVTATPAKGSPEFSELEPVTVVATASAVWLTIAAPKNGEHTWTGDGKQVVSI